jgi:trigger factor
MELTVQVEKTSPVLRKLTIKVPSKTVDAQLQRGLSEVQRSAKIKGFRQGAVPMHIVKQYFGSDISHRVFHDLIEDAYRAALREQKIRAVGSPKIETPKHQTGAQEHDHGIAEGQDLHFTAEVEVLPEIEVKNYTGLSLSQESTDVTDSDVTALFDRIRDSQAQLVPASGGLVGADGTETSRPAKKGDFADLAFDGGMVTDGKVVKRPDMKGSQLIELGSGSMIPGFEEEVLGLRSGDAKTFRITFPQDYAEKSLAGAEAEFDIKLNALKEKQLAALDDDFAKTLGYENLEDMRAKAREHLVTEKAQEVDRKLKSDLIAAVAEKNSFDVPASLIQAQTRSLAQDVAQNLKQQGFTEQMIQEALTTELPTLSKRAESQVRASLLLEAIAAKEGITVSAEEVDAEIAKMAATSRMDPAKFVEFYNSNPGRKADVEFRMREDRTLTFLLEKSKVKKSK